MEDCTQFRSGIALYLMHIHGLKDDTVSYQRINKIMTIEHKTYFRKIMIEPHNITVDDFSKLHDLNAENRAHIGIIVMETRKRVELLYVTRALDMIGYC